MDITLIVSLTKERLGIRTNVRDTLLTAIAQGIVAELTDEKGVVLVEDDLNHLMFCVDYATWRYQNPSSDVPRHLKYRLHNMIIHAGSDTT